MSKPKGKAPAFQLYAGDFLTDVMDWSDEQVGAHIRLLCWSWVNRRGIPRDTQRLTRIAPGAVEAWPVIGSKWIDGPDDTWVNERLESTRSESDAFRASQRERSLLAVAARQGQRGPNREPMEEPKGKPMGSPFGDPLEGEEEVFTQNRKEHAKVEPTAIVWPAWAGDQTRAKWGQFKAYRKQVHKFSYKGSASEQSAINLLAKEYTNGQSCVDALDEAMAKGWKWPVKASDRATKPAAPPKPGEIDVRNVKPWLIP